jgi:hypothetical protein
MKTACIAFGEKAVMRYMSGSVLLAALLSSSAVATPSHPPSPEQASFFCYWVDGAHKQAAITDLFPARVAQADDISAQFAKAMRKEGKGKGRVYDCGWRRDAAQAAQDREHLRTAHASQGYAITDFDWDPIDG